MPLFSDWLRGYLDENRLSYEKFGEMVGKSGPSVGSWVRGKFLPEKDTMRLIAEKTGRDFDDLAAMAYGWERPTTEQAPLDRYRDILKQLEYISDDGLALLRDQIRFVLRERYPRVLADGAPAENGKEGNDEESDEPNQSGGND